MIIKFKNNEINYNIMSFTDRLYNETYESHKDVDRHPFVSFIRRDKLAGEMYINFNKICINEIQKVLRLKDNSLQSKLYRNIELSENVYHEMYDKILNRCREYPLESAYQFYLGLLFGGNMLKKMLPDHTDFLTYENPKNLIKEFKDYLCEEVVDQELFIQNVNESYKIIKILFDEFYDECLDGGPDTYPELDEYIY